VPKSTLESWHITAPEPVQGAIWGLTHAGPRKHVIDGVEISPWQGAILGLSGPLKSTGNLCCVVCSKKDHSMPNSGIQALLLQPTAMVPTSVTLQCHTWKICPCDAAFFKILWPLVTIIIILLLPLMQVKTDKNSRCSVIINACRLSKNTNNWHHLKVWNIYYNTAPY